MIRPEDLAVPNLGPGKVDSPLKDLLASSCHKSLFIRDDQKVIFDTDASNFQSGAEMPTLELAGPREKIFFNPKKSKAAIVTCGGLCPGLNDVIRSVVMTLHYRYGVTDILGIPFGYQGFIDQYKLKPIPLTPASVTDIHKVGGTILGTSRGIQDSGKIVQFLQRNHINLLFILGGDGTLRAALEISEIAEQKKLNVSVIGIPKTVDNDILYIDRSFGFATAAAAASQVITIAHSEAVAQAGGIGLVKVMGRHSGFIACAAALATNDANFVLIPEIPFELDGENGFLSTLKQRIKARGHAVILVAEGAGQELLQKSGETDASGNVRLSDIGLHLKEKINIYFKSLNIKINLKYIDPSYIVRAVAASPVDSVYCLRLGQHAVHAAMSGKTKMVVGLRNAQLVHLPMSLLAKGRKHVDPNSDLWLSVLDATGQPSELRTCAIDVKT